MTRRFRANLELRATKDGGRTTPAVFGRYRPTAVFADDTRHQFGGIQIKPGLVTSLVPGNAGEVEIEIEHSDSWPVALTSGLKVRLFEGAREIGIIEMLSELQQEK